MKEVNFAHIIVKIFLSLQSGEDVGRQQRDESCKTHQKSQSLIINSSYKISHESESMAPYSRFEIRYYGQM